MSGRYIIKVKPSLCKMKDRIKLIMEQAQLSQQDFARRLEISPASLSSIFTGRTNPTNNHVSAIHRAFPLINVNWLMFGEGDMYMSDLSDGTDEAGGTNDEALAATGEGSGGSSAVAGVSRGGLSPDVYGAEQPSLFPDVAERAGRRADFPSVSGGRHSAGSGIHSRESRVGMPTDGISGISMKNIDIIQRKIKEIRVFFDDGTYESFVPSVK